MRKNAAIMNSPYLIKFRCIIHIYCFIQPIKELPSYPTQRKNKNDITLKLEDKEINELYYGLHFVFYCISLFMSQLNQSI